jgi:hypothetical protein
MNPFEALVMTGVASLGRREDHYSAKLAAIPGIYDLISFIFIHRFRMLFTNASPIS